MENKNEENAEEKVPIRHTINAEETFTLAKDVFDLRCFIKNVYANRAVIARRLNVLTLTVSTVFMLLYTAYALFTALTSELALGTEIALYSMLGVYGALFIALIIVYACSLRANTKSMVKYKRVLNIIKLLVRITSIAISITAIVFANGGGGMSAQNAAVQILIVVFSVITVIVQIIPVIFGGTGKLVRWLLSPVKVKTRFSSVLLEWYQLAVSGSAREGAVKKVSSEYFDDIGVLIDNYLVPQVGKKYIGTFKSVTLLNLVEHAPDEDKLILEGVLKNVFAYAEECGYITFNPCRDLPFEGSVEVEEKQPRQTMKGRLLKVGQRIGKSVLDKYITGSADKD
ncbi:MAG: hypothetical protein K2N30_00025 [Clostridia bacterium]|nr:hypothetical protein [Clostridia bacterium]